MRRIAHKDIPLDSLTIERVRAVLSYNKRSGIFRWKAGNRVGREAGWITANGYREIQIDGKTVLGHRLAWFIGTGEWPKGLIDHRRDRADNRWRRIREATHSQNSTHRRGNAGTASGVKGVYRNGRKWMSRIGDGGDHYLGTFDTKREAALAYNAASKRLHGEYGLLAEVPE